MTDTPPVTGTTELAPPTTETTPETNWMSGFDDDSTGFVQNKGWKAPGDVLNAYRELESFRGVPADQLIKMPKDYTDPEAWGDVYNKLGRPESAEGYQFGDLAEQLVQDDAALQGIMHKAGLSQNQAAIVREEVNALLNTQVDGESSQAQQEFQAAVDADMATLKQEWGVNYDKHVAQGQQAVQQFGIEPETIDQIEQAIGTKATLSLMQRIGSGMGEHTFVNGHSTGNGAMTREMASAKLLELRGNKDFSVRLIGGDPAANAEIDRLIKIKAGA